MGFVTAVGFFVGGRGHGWGEGTTVGVEGCVVVGWGCWGDVMADLGGGGEFLAAHGEGVVGFLIFETEKREVEASRLAVDMYDRFPPLFGFWKVS